MSERAQRLAALAAAYRRPGATLTRPMQGEPRARVEANAERSAEVFLYGVVGWDIWAEELVPELAALDVDHLVCHVNSPGGDAFDGIALANTLAAHKAKVTMHIEGMAASAASVIAMAGDEIVMHPGARLMIHDALCLTVGNAADHRAAIELLDAVSQDIAGIYASRAGGSPDEWRQKMLAETWLGADEAVTAGLADRVVTREQADETAVTPLAARAWSDLVATWRGDALDAARPAAPLAASCCTGPCQHLPADESAPQSSAPEADATPPAELPTAAVNLADLVCGAIREAVS